jgi:hypothetical protein
MKLISWIEGKLVDDWRSGKRWVSAWGSAGGVGFSLVAGAIVKGTTIAVAFVGFIPLIWIPVLSAAFSGIALVGRFVKQTPPKYVEDETDSAGC